MKENMLTTPPGRFKGISRLISVESNGIEIARVDRRNRETYIYPTSSDRYPLIAGGGSPNLCEFII